MLLRVRRRRLQTDYEFMQRRRQIGDNLKAIRPQSA
jgi:hypothetical protein